ncbi:MAG: hypothetical protein QM538_06210 [Methylacidiphilales bacterium]|nr:hypothetical protein [Candidatus Methylacidiphilales bacterium]
MSESVISKHHLAKIREYFDNNVNEIKSQGSHTLNNHVITNAYIEVVAYWLKHEQMKNSIIASEEKIQENNINTTKGRVCSLQGVVDIMQYDDVEMSAALFEIKTQPKEYLTDIAIQCEKQLSLCKEIWSKNINNKDKSITNTYVISTSVPRHIKQEIKKLYLTPESSSSVIQSNATLDSFIRDWDPILQINTNAKLARETIADCKEIVDQIEDYKFNPPPPSVLKKVMPVSKRPFGSEVCRHCDVRFSCESYKAFVSSTNPKEIKDKILSDDTDTEFDIEMYL